MYRFFLLIAALFWGISPITAQTDDMIPRTENMFADSVYSDTPAPCSATKDTDIAAVNVSTTLFFPEHRLLSLSFLPDHTPWILHNGFNAQFGLSVSAAFGGHAPKGTGFGQHATFAYMHPVGKKGQLAAGIYAVNLDWGRYKYTDIGLSALYVHEFSERFTLYAYMSKRLTGHDDFRPVQPACCGTPDFSTGIGMNHKISEKIDVGLSVSFEKYENRWLPVFPHGSGLKEFGSPLW